jgi:hypothetical protein
MRAGATISTRCWVAYCGATRSYATPSGATITVFGTMTVRYCAGVRWAMTRPGATITVSCTVRYCGGATYC